MRRLLPLHVAHREYQERLQESIIRLVEENPALRVDVEAYADAISLFWSMDLDRSAPILRRTYDRGGPVAIDPVVSAPDADWNWESSEGRWVFGLRFYELTSARGQELPLAVGMPTKPQQNDAITGYVCLYQYHQLTGRPIYAAYFDSAHDNTPMYNLIRSCSAIPYIDLRMGVPLGGDGRPKVIENTKDIGLGGIDATGTPHCAMSAMAWRGTSGGYQRFDCPAARRLRVHHAGTVPTAPYTYDRP